MNPNILLWLVPALCSPAAHGTEATLLANALTQDEEGPSYEERLAQAGDDVAGLWEIHTWCRAQHKYSESRKTLKRIIALDAEHAEARAALGHTFYDARWFESSYKLSEYKRTEEKRKLEEEGLVRLGDEWVPQGDAAFLRMGWAKSQDGIWLSKIAASRKAEIARLESEGWKRQTDQTWVSPDNVSKWTEGLWKCGDEWLTTEDANKHHSTLGNAWHWPSKYFTLFSTLDHEGNSWAAFWADQVYPDCLRAYGIHPKSPPTVSIVRDMGQYNALASGDPATQRPPTESNGFSSCHFAYVGEVWFDMTIADPNDLANTLDYLGGGICYWDRNNPDLSGYGVHAVRHATALSYAEALDPSWEAVSKFMSNPNGQGTIAGFWTEKRIPRWFRFGVASYCERFFKDPQPNEGFSEWWARDWALDNIRRGGGPRALDQIFAFNLDPNDQSGKLIGEAGMLVSFVLDGECGPVKEKHAAFKAALRDGGDTQAAIEGLQQAIVDNSEAFHEHIGM